MKLALSNSENLHLQINTLELLATNQAEEIAMLQRQYKRLKNTRTTSICISGAGLILGVTGYILKQDETTKNIGNILFSSGIVATGSGLLTLSISFIF